MLARRWSRGEWSSRPRSIGTANTYPVHVLLWASSHLLAHWIWPPILLGSLARAWSGPHSMNPWAGIITHQAHNALVFVVLVLIAV
jgi:hypothetical protein